ncbi:MAG: hypothetical protein A2Y12_08790 [Planctomycetes bacterium GWF2_42_9]|nr:MAG: hypothetical protein A2Y12_08790 [Planctomycetes bacterium GWF2_42_9]HAL45494.1 hypothetical protein [Phycisphaerales bacterium]
MKHNLIQKGLEADARRIKERILMGITAEKAKEAAERLTIFMEERGWTQTYTAQKLGISPAQLNQVLQNKYKGALDDTINKIVNLIESQSRKERRVKGKDFVQTSVAKKIHTLIVQTEALSDDEGKIGVVVGDGGHGKSKCLEAYSKSNKNTIYIQLDDAMNPTTMFNAIAEKIGVVENGSLAVITRRLIEHLQHRQIIVLLDEASHLRVRQLNQLRQIIAVKCKCPMILAGNSDLLKTIYQPTVRRGCESLDQLASRISYVVNLDDMASQDGGGLYTTEDIKKLYEFGGIKLTNDAVKAMKTICKTPHTGRLRICSLIISALHTAAVVNKTGQIDAELIGQCIDDLDLPVKAKLPLSLVTIDDEDKQEVKAKIA